MRQPDEVVQRLRTRFERDYPNWVMQGGSWPMRIRLQPPTTAERSERPVDCHTWADRWARYDGPGELEYATIKFPTGKHSMPKTLALRGPGEVAAADPDMACRWQRCTTRLEALLDELPRADLDRHLRKIVDLDQRDYDRLVNTAAWLRRNPTSGMLIRQLPIEGIDTKWLGKNDTLVLALLGADDTEDATGEQEQPEYAHPESRSRQLHQRLGLRVAPELVQVAVLDPDLRASLGGMRAFAAAVEDLNNWPKRPSTVLILENQETGYAFTEDLPGVVVLHGMGANIASYARIDWVRGADVLYWGDIDGPGLRFVADLRAHAIPARTVLMDLPTLQRFRHLAVDGATPYSDEPDPLTDAERELYRHLADYATENGTGLLLEQERIPWPHAEQTLAEAITQGSSARDGATWAKVTDRRPS